MSVPTRLVIVALLLCAAPAYAQSEPVRSPAERRAVPDYDGLPPPGPTPEEVLLWIPRLALSPLYIATEYAIRRPFGWLATELERAGVPIRIYELLTWDEHHAGLVPTAFYEFGLLPSVGLYFFWNDAGAPGHRVRANAAFGGVDYLRLAVGDHVVLSPGVELRTAIEAQTRPDQIYQGLGSSSQSADRARYRHGTVLGSAALVLRPWRESEVRVELAVVDHALDASGYDPGGVDPSLADAVQSGQLRDLPPGFEGYTAYRQRLFAVLDTREPAPAPRHGVRLEAFAEQGFDLRTGAARSWIRYGGALAGHVDLGDERVVSLHAWTELADPLSDAEVPFLEQARIGGSLLELPGFYAGQLVGRSALVTTLQYRYPIWSLADASIFVGMGNVFGAHFDGIGLEAMRVSWGIALSTASGDDHGFSLALAFGTATIEQGAGIESVRFLVGGAPSF